MAIKYFKLSLNIPTFTIQKDLQNLPKFYFWLENKPSGSPDFKRTIWGGAKWVSVYFTVMWHELEKLSLFQHMTKWVLHQGDQIGRVFAYWAIVYFDPIFK
jgi:hypothetical protein